MTEYSERSKQLAQQLAEKATKNLARSGKTVTRNEAGRYVVSRQNPKDASTRRQKG